MSSSTMIFRLCDEDDDLDLASEPLQHTAERSPAAPRRSRPRQFAFRRAEQRKWEPSDRSARGGSADGEPWTAELAEEPGGELAPESWDVDPEDSRASGAMFDWGVEDPDREGQIDGDPLVSPSGPEHAGAFGAGASFRSWFSHRVVAVGAIAIVALLVVAIGHSSRQAGRGSVRQRPVAAAAVGATAGAPLPAPVASPPSGRRPSPQPPAASSAKPRRARRDQRTGSRPRPANTRGRRAHVKAAAHAASKPNVAPVSASAPEQASAPAPVVVTAPAQVRSDPRPRQAASPDSGSTLAEFSFER